MRIKVDEDLPRAAIQMLRDMGYEAVGVAEQGMEDGRITLYGRPYKPNSGSW